MKNVFLHPSLFCSSCVFDTVFEDLLELHFAQVHIGCWLPGVLQCGILGVVV